MEMEEESIVFYEPNFIANSPLTPTNILEYFSLSQFYDKKCLNEILKMQSQFANIDISHKLTSTPGVYYILEQTLENLFIIAKKNNDGIKTTILKVYYCMYGYIYCAPSVRAVSDTRIIDMLSHLNDAIDKYEEKKTFDWLKGVQFKQQEKVQTENQNEIKFLFEVLHDYENSFKFNH